MLVNLKKAQQEHYAVGLFNPLEETAHSPRLSAVAASFRCPDAALAEEEQAFIESMIKLMA